MLSPIFVDLISNIKVFLITQDCIIISLIKSQFQLDSEKASVNIPEEATEADKMAERIQQQERRETEEAE